MHENWASVHPYWTRCTAHSTPTVMFRGKTLGYGLALVLAVAGSLALLRPRLHEAFVFLPKMSCSKTDTADGALRADLHFLSGLGPGSNLVQLTDGGESAEEILSNLKSYQALVVVTAGRSKLTRRSEGQPFISVVHEEPGLLQQRGEQEDDQAQPGQELQQQGEEEEEGDEQQQERALLTIKGDEDAGDVGDGAGAKDDRHAGAAPAVYDNGLAALAAAAGLMNSAAAGLERVLGRRLFPLHISLYDRTAGGTVVSGPYAIFDASAGHILLDRQFVSYTWGNDDRPQVSYMAVQLASRMFTQLTDMIRTSPPTFASSAASDTSSATAAATEPQQEPAAAAASGGGGGGSAAAAAAQLAAAAVAVALPAAFAAAPPLWFCILCPSVLGLLAPVLINLALNQLAGLLCSQLHLTDDACFDVLLGALGAGFVLSLASAVPIFFVCRLPQCAGHNVTAALRRLLPPLR